MKMKKMNKIRIRKSVTADSRTCDFNSITKDELIKSTVMHQMDVSEGIDFIIDKLYDASDNHDITKIDYIDEFYFDFKSGFKKTNWWKKHQKEERHHLKNSEYIQDDVNLIDIIESVVDGCVAGMARSGNYKFEDINKELLLKAYINTIKLVLDNIVIEEE